MFTKILYCLLFVSFILSSCGKSDKDNLQTEKQSQTTGLKSDTIALKDAKYVCPMHPLERSMAPARCPICRMNLVPVAELNKEMSEVHNQLEKKFAGKKEAVYFGINLPVIKSDECIPIMESALSKDPGILGYHVDILNRVIHTYIDKNKTTKNNVEQLIANAGFNANDTKASTETVNNLPKGCK